MTLAINNITDWYYYESVPDGAPFKEGAAGAYVYCGDNRCITIASLPDGDVRESLVEWINGIAEAVRTGHASSADFRVVHKGSPYRALRSNSLGLVQVSLRQLATTMPQLKELLIKPYLMRLLSHAWFNEGGLLLFSGLTGQGKTTVASAAVLHRLELFGGRAQVVVDVQEMPMEGVWGHGSCRQLQVDYTAAADREAGFAGAIRQAYRSMPATRPAILFVGEVRDTETAVEVVRAAANGMLVVSTIHAVDSKTALMRLVTLAEKEMGDAAASVTAEAVRMVVHQSIAFNSAAAGWNRASYNTQLLVSGGTSSAVANNIRRKAWEQMTSIINQQQLWLEGRGASSEVELMNRLRGVQA